MTRGAVRSLWAFAPVIAFLGLYVAVAATRPLPAWVALVYAAASILCFVVYAVDKSAARGRRRRISERMLLLLGLLCGWPGAVIGQQLLRHKTQKRSFRTRFWATVVLNVGAFIALAVVVR